VGRDQDFRDFVLKNSATLFRSAYVLTRDRGHAEDLVQNALLRVYLSWNRVDRANDPYAYTQRILFTSLSRMRRRHRVRETLGITSDTATGLRNHEAADDRDQLIRALDQLPDRQRLVLVLRFYEDMSVEQVAKLLGCSVGTVKSRTARALSRLRLSPQFEAYEGR
jgi:RNA polymerase sigma-70 factor (sigma-E family)